MAKPTSPENTIRSEQAADEMRSTPATIPGKSPEIIHQPDRPYDGTDTDYDMQPDADASVEQLDPTPTNSRSSKYNLRHNPKPNCNDDYRTHTCIFRKSQERVMELICGEPTYFFSSA